MQRANLENLDDAAVVRVLNQQAAAGILPRVNIGAHDVRIRLCDDRRRPFRVFFWGQRSI